MLNNTVVYSSNSIIQISMYMVCHMSEFYNIRTIYHSSLCFCRSLGHGKLFKCSILIEDELRSGRDHCSGDHCREPETVAPHGTH